MEQKDFKRFQGVLYGMAEALGGEITADGATMWWGILKEYNIEEVVAAAYKVAKTQTKMPPPSVLVKEIEGDSAGASEVEATKVLNAIKSVGPYDSVAFDDPTTTAVVVYGYGSWEDTIRAAEQQADHWFIKDFSRKWQAFKAQGVQLAGKCPGQFERLNSAHGFGDRKQRLHLVGDTHKAKQMALEERNTNNNGAGIALRLMEAS